MHGKNPEDTVKKISELACDQQARKAKNLQLNRKKRKVITSQLGLYKGQVDQVLEKTFSDSLKRPVTSHSQSKVNRIWKLVSEINRLHSKLS